MGGKLNDIQLKLDELSERIADGSVGTARPWGGAGVVVRRKPLPVRAESFYPDPRAVVTPFVGELSWLFERLWGVFRPALDHMTKLEFFGRLGNAAARYHEQAGVDASVRGLLSSVLATARAIADELEDGTFEALAVAPDRAIAEDFGDMKEPPA
jgi:hypothetical protein